MKPPFGARLVKPYSHCGLWAAVNRGNEMGSEYGINRRSCGPRAQFETRTISPGRQSWSRFGAAVHTHVSSSGRIGQDVGLAPLPHRRPRGCKKPTLRTRPIAILAGTETTHIVPLERPLIAEIPAPR